jgi:GalNAc-alpha-(1->4)-GalNAc-alpha-(1->3)-diNAcBac-PP-undecaprenol alpha-1,4-N-acetyl-D-galactosaminyltransferase
MSEKTSLVVALYFFRLANSSGGAERMICLLANELVKRGIVVHLISWDEVKDGDTFYPLGKEVNWHRLGFPSRIKGKVTRTFRLRNCLKQHHIDVLVGFVMSSDKVVYTAAKIAGVKLVVAERNAPSLYRIRYSFFQRWLCFSMLQFADAITVQFPSYALGYPGMLRPRISAIANPVSSPLSQAMPDQADAQGRFCLLMTGRLDRLQKRTEILIKAFLLIAAQVPEWDLRVIGNGPDKEYLKGLITNSEFSDRIFMEKAREDIFSIYSGVHLFAMTSLWEGFPNALAEAMSAGLPVIGFAQADGVRHLIEDEKAGWLVEDNGSIKAFSQALLDAMTDHRERVRRGAYAAKRMLKYNPEAQFKQWVELLSQL